MTEPKRIHRPAPCSQFDIPATQSWIEDMYAKGWHLEPDCFFIGLFNFIQGEPMTVRCRLEATDTNGGFLSNSRTPTPEAEALCNDMGWQWMGRRGQFHIYITSDPAAPELHTDPRIQAQSIKALTKYLQNSLGNSLFSLVFYTVLIWGFELAIFTALVGLWRTVVYAVLLVSPLVNTFIQAVRFHRMRRLLEQGETPPQRRSYGRWRWYYYLKGPVYALLLVGVILSTFVQVSGKQQQFDQVTTPLPFATIGDLFPDAELDTSTAYMGGCTLTTYGDWFTPVNSEFGQSADVTLPDGTTIWADINVMYHRTRYDWFAGLLTRDHLSHAQGSVMDRIFTDGVEVTELTGLGCDYAATWEDIYTYVLVRQGNEVVRLSYNRSAAVQLTPQEVAQIVLASME